MEDSEIVREISTVKKSSSIKRAKKFAGALTVEILKHALEDAGICVSSRNVFIKGIPVEIDLLVPKRSAIPEYRLLYAPEDVLVVLEIKSYGSFGKSTINRTKANFEQIHRTNKKIYCVYVTLEERKGYKWAVSDENLGFPTYTLFWHSGSGAKYRSYPTGDWKRLISDIINVIQANEGAMVEGTN